MKKMIITLSLLFTLLLVGSLYLTLAQDDKVETRKKDYAMSQPPDQIHILIYQLTEENIG